MLKNWRCRSTFWSSDVERLHAAVAKSTFGSEHVKKLTVSEHFLKFWCRKIARRCGEKHIWKWKCKKNWHSGSTFWSSDAQKLHTAVAKRTFWSKNVQNTSVSEHFSNIWCAKIARRCDEKPLFEVKMYKTRQQRTVFWSCVWCGKISQVVS